MKEFFQQVLAADFLPHGHCYFWKTEIVALHVISDAMIFLAYFTIPITLFYFTRKRTDLPYPWMFRLFAAFIFACGTTHLFSIITLWYPIYRVDGLVKLATGIISVTTAALLIPLMPLALALPGLRTANEALKSYSQALADANAKLSVYANIVSSSNDAILAKDANGFISSWNKAAEHLYGYTEAEVLGKSVSIIIPPHCIAEHEINLERLRRGEPIKHLQTQRMTKSGKILDVSLSLSPILDPQGNFQGASSIARDITESRKANEHFRLAIEAAPNAMIMIDQRGNIVLVNQKTEEMFGYSRDELINKRVEILIPERWRKEHPEYRDLFFKSPRPRAMGEGRDLFGLKKNGQEFPVEIGLTPIFTESWDPLESTCRHASLSIL